MQHLFRNYTGTGTTWYNWAHILQARPELFRAMIREFFIQAKRDPWKGEDGFLCFFSVDLWRNLLRNESVARLFGVYSWGDLNVVADTFLDVLISEAALTVERPNHEQHSGSWCVAMVAHCLKNHLFLMPNGMNGHGVLLTIQKRAAHLKWKLFLSPV